MALLATHRQPSSQQHISEPPIHRIEQQPDSYVGTDLHDAMVQAAAHDDDLVPHSPVVLFPSADECFHSVSSSTQGGGGYLQRRRLPLHL